MRKFWLIISLLLIVSIAACNGQQAAQAPATEEPAAPDTTSPVDSGPVQPSECRVVGLFDFPEVPMPGDIPEVNETDWIYGNPDAPVTILEYSEAQCPYCAVLEPSLVELQSQYPDDVRLVFRHFPLNIHDKANLAAQAMEAAGKQETKKFYEMKNFLFENQATWSAMSVADFQAYLIEAAGEFDLDTEQFTADLSSAEITQKIQEMAAGGSDAGVAYTPYVLINGFTYEGNRDVESLAAMVQAYKELSENEGSDMLAGLPRLTLNDPASVSSILETYQGVVEEYGADVLASIPSAFLSDAANMTTNIDYYLKMVEDYGQTFVDEIPSIFFSEPANLIEYLELYIQLKESLGDKTYDTCPPQVIDTEKSYTATLETEKGDIVIELYASQAPTTVNSFVFLAQEGWFDGVTFHRVLPGFVAQSGDPSGLGLGGPGYEFGNENNGLLFDKAGVVGMANSGADSNGSQFFITLAAADQLNGGYTVFGQVVEGMDVVESLTARDPSQSNDLPAGDVINKIVIEEK